MYSEKNKFCIRCLRSGDSTPSATYLCNLNTVNGAGIQERRFIHPDTCKLQYLDIIGYASRAEALEVIATIAAVTNSRDVSYLVAEHPDVTSSVIVADHFSEDDVIERYVLVRIDGPETPRFVFEDVQNEGVATRAVRFRWADSAEQFISMAGLRHDSSGYVHKVVEARQLFNSTAGKS